MSKIRLWAIGRRIQYGLGFASFWVLIGALIYFVNYYQPPTCLDEKQNGDETGLDCGGSCVQICPNDVLPPQVTWAKSFEITKGQYNVVAYVENTNQTAGVPELEYVIELLNDGAVVAERSGRTELPPNSVYPIFEGRVFTEGKLPVTETRITLKPSKLWLPASVVRDQFRSLDIALTGADERPRLDVEIENTDLQTAAGVEVVATIFNEGGEPATASQTFIERIDGRTTQNIVFTWPNSIAKTVKSCIIPTDVVIGIDLSGSMNNDGGDPPQPVTAALQAASQFAKALNDNDRASVVTFATDATIVTELSNVHGSVADDILALSIAPKEETGYTNTVAALEAARTELDSERHNPDARRVLVLLTDGLPTAKGDVDVVSEAAAKAAELITDEIEIYAIGLGEGVDREFINKVASEAEHAYFAPTGADLQRIYAEITSSLCAAGPTKIDVIAKTKTNFEQPR